MLQKRSTPGLKEKNRPSTPCPPQASLQPLQGLRCLYECDDKHSKLFASAGEHSVNIPLRTALYGKCC